MQLDINDLQAKHEITWHMQEDTLRCPNLPLVVVWEEVGTAFILCTEESRLCPVGGAVQLPILKVNFAVGWRSVASCERLQHARKNVVKRGLL